MWSDLPSGLKNWLLTLGFDRQNLSDTQIENEFLRLSPPEMRDIWRNTMVHVVSVEKKRYIKKALLLNELKKQRSHKVGSHSLPKNLKSVAELETYRIYEKALFQLNGRELLIRDIRAKIDELKENLDKLNEERRCLIGKEKTFHYILTIIRLKTESYEKLIEELANVRDCLKYAGSNLWNLADTRSRLQPTEDFMKNLLERVHEFGTRRLTLGDSELISEQRKLQENISNSLSTVSPSAVQKNVVHLLENCLSSLLKLREKVSEKSRETNNNIDFEWELPELKKQCVRTYIDNHNLQMKVKEQEKKVQEQVSELILNFEMHCKDENEKTIVRNWLDMELLKHRMTSRFNFLKEREQIASNEMSTLSDTIFTNVSDRHKFFKRINDVNDQMVKLEDQIRCNLSYLSDKSIDVFVNYQRVSKNRIEKFLQRENSSICKMSSGEFPDKLKTEICLLEKLDFPHSEPRNYNIVEHTRRTNFLLHLESAYNSFFQRVSYLNFAKAIVADKVLRVKSSEEEFRALMSKLLEETKDNLRSVEKEAETCSKNIELCTNFSIDKLIPEHMVVDKYTFSQWQEKYRACIRNLPK